MSTGLVVIAASLALAAPTSAVPPTPENLEGAVAEDGTPPTFSWDRVPKATKYEVQIDNDADFSSHLGSYMTVNRRLVPTAPLPSGAIYWRVRATDASGNSPWANATVTLAPVQVPGDLSPNDSEVLSQPESPPVLSWSPVPGAKEYVVQVSRQNDNFVGAKEHRTANTSLIAPEANTGGIYEWHVKAVQATGIESFYSDPATFEIRSLDQVNNLEPDSLTPAITDVVLSWDAVPGAKSYELEVAREASFNPNEIIDAKTNILGTTFSPAITYDDAEYWWRVRAIDLNGEPTPWPDNPARFTRRYDAQPTPVHPVQAVDQATPAEVTDDLYFEWTPIPHASTYELDISSDAAFSPLNTITCTVAGTTYTTGAFAVTSSGNTSTRTNERCNPAPGQVTYWRVRAIDLPAKNPTVESRYSTINSLIYRPKAFESTAAFSPANGDTVAVPTMTWRPEEWADSYSVRLMRGNGSQVASVNTRATSWTPVLSSPLKPSDGPFVWTVSANRTTGGPASLLHSSQFNLAGEPDPTGADPLTPLTAVSFEEGARAPLMSWEPMPGAASYRVYAGVSGTGILFPSESSNVLGKKLSYPAVTDPSSLFLQNTSYDWRVEAFDGDGRSMGSGPRATFTTIDLAPAEERSIALTGSTLDAGSGCAKQVGDPDDICTNAPATPVFDWAPVEGASFYMIYIAQDPQFTNLIDEGPIPATTSTRWTPTLSTFAGTIPESETDAPYYWTIRPCKSLGACAADPVGTVGSATNKFRKKSPKVTLVAPAPGAAVTTTAVTFDWEDYHVTNGATHWAETRSPREPGDLGEPGVQAAQSYLIEVSTTDTFSSVIDRATVDQSTFTSPSKLYPEGDLFWRVRALDGAGRPLDWSETRRLVKTSGTVVQTGPTDGQEVSDSSAFRWEAQPFAKQYEIEVYKNNDTAFSSANRIISATVTQNAYSWTQPIPFSTLPYIWRVRRVDASGNKGAWQSKDAAFTFFSNGAVPTALTPQPNTVVPASGAHFSWTGVQGAARYRLEYTRAGNTTRVTTAALAHAPTTALPEGDHSWSVVALDAKDQPMGAEDVPQLFKVVKLPPLVSGVAITGPTQVGGQLFATRPEWDVLGVDLTYQWLRDGEPIPDETGTSYTTSIADAGRTITVRADGQHPEFGDLTSLSDPVTIDVRSAPEPIAPIELEGPGAVATVLGIAPITWTDPAAQVTGYQWLRDGEPIRRATDATYLIDVADFGRALSVRVTATAPGRADATVTSNSIVVTGGDAPLALEPPSVSGTPVVGSTLRAHRGEWTPTSGLRFQYQWLRNGSAVAGANSSVYRLTVGDAVSRISLRVTAQRTGYRNGVATSDALTVPKVRSTTTTSLSPTQVKRKTPVTIRVRVSATGVATPTGKLTIKRGKKKLVQKTLKGAHRGYLSIKIGKKKLKKKGRYKLVVHYTGNAQIAASKSKKTVLTVTK